MKNKFLKKTLGIMLVASMLCMLVATGCADSDTTADSKKSEVIKLSEHPDSVNLGATIEGENIDYDYIYISTVTAPSYFENKILDERVKDVIVISGGNEDDSSGSLNGKVKVSIPYEEGMHLLAVENDIAYDVDTEYIDGCYVFETDKLGEFIISTEPIGRTKPQKTKNVELVEQTITDERTGVQVSGMLPDDALMCVELLFLSDTDSHHVYDSPESDEDEDSEAVSITDYLVEWDYEASNISIEEEISAPDWANGFYTYGGKIMCDITFIKDFEILDFKSDLTVTLPFDFHNALPLSDLSRDVGTAAAVQYDYDSKEYVRLEVIPLEDTPQGKFQLITKASGAFVIGGKVRIDEYVDEY